MGKREQQSIDALVASALDKDDVDESAYLTLVGRRLCLHSCTGGALAMIHWGGQACIDWKPASLVLRRGMVTRPTNVKYALSRGR